MAQHLKYPDSVSSLIYSLALQLFGHYFVLCYELVINILYDVVVNCEPCYSVKVANADFLATKRCDMALAMLQ